MGQQEETATVTVFARTTRPVGTGLKAEVINATLPGPGVTFKTGLVFRRSKRNITRHPYFLSLLAVPAGSDGRQVATKLLIEKGKSYLGGPGWWVVLSRIRNNSIGSSSDGFNHDETSVDLKGVDR